MDYTHLERVALDVSEYEAPEPMRQILLHLTTLSETQYLQVTHRKEPIPLYSTLIEMGFVYLTETNKPITDYFTISICHKAQLISLENILGVTAR